MKDRSRNFLIISGIIALIALSIVVVIITKSCASAGDRPYPTIDNSAELYESACSTASNLTDFTVQISTEKVFSPESKQITERSTQTISFSAFNTENMRAITDETLSYNNHNVEISEIYADSTVYTTINGSRFQGNILYDAYILRYAPLLPINSELYSAISGVDTGDSYLISFSGATSLESWADHQAYKLIDASASVRILKDGTIKESKYIASYSVNGMTVQNTVTVEITDTESVQIQPPENPSDYTVLTSLDAPRMLEKACGYLSDAKSIDSHYKDRILCEAFGDQRNQDIQLKASNNGDWSAEIITNIDIVNSSKAGVTSSLTQTEKFHNNKYSITIDNVPQDTNSDITLGDMQRYCRDLLVGTVMLPQYITDATINDADDTLTITLTGNSNFAKLLDAEACATLYKDDSVLTDLMQSYTINTIECYLKINKLTGLPIASGFKYQGTYVINDLPYSLEFFADQEYLLAKEAGV